MHDHPRRRPRSLRREARSRATRLFVLFTLFQIAVAFLVHARSKAAQRRRLARRPPEYRWRAFDEVPVEGVDDLALLYMRGSEFLDDVIEAIDSAQETVYVETFIWVDDHVGRLVRDAVSRAAARGVRCRVVYDGFLSTRGLDRGFFGRGVDVVAYKPVRADLSLLKPTNVLRTHRKVVTIDSRIGFVGGYNFGAEYLEWRDTHLRITGPSVAELENVFVDFWNQQRAKGQAPLPNDARRSWDPTLLVHRNNPSLATFPIRGMYIEAIDRADDVVWITNAYFVPDLAFRNVLKDASRRGVDVRVMLPERSNHPLTDALAHGLFDDLLSVGVRIYLYRDFMVHAKTCVIDDRWVTVGTANLDRWSMFGNHEVNVEIRSEHLATQMRELFLFDLESCREIHHDVWRRRPLHMQLAERTLRSLAPLL